MFKKILILLTLIISTSANDKPNILFIFTDDQSHRTVSCYDEAYDWVKTPNIDNLAKTGIRFKSAYLGTWCMPSRLTMLTGLLQHGMNSVRMTGKYPASEYDPKQIPFWPAEFRKNGYFTGHVGKWHTGIDSGYGRDWDYQIVWNRPKYTDNAFSYYDNQETELNGKYIGNIKGYSTDNYTKWAEEFINGKSRKSDKPWALWLCYAGVHGPFTPAERHTGEYQGVKIPTPKSVFPPREGKPAHLRDRDFWVPNSAGKPILKNGKQSIHGETLYDWTRQYHQAVLSVDEGVGRVIKALKDSGQYDNTFIIFTSDQGFAWGQHGYMRKVAPYDDTIKAPLIISYPKNLPSNKTVDYHVSGADIVPTLSELTGIKLPWKMHGRSLMPVLKEPSKKWDYPVVMTYTKYLYGKDTDNIPTDRELLYHKSGVPWWSSVTQGKYKYIQTLIEGEIPELYDLEADPKELKNLALNSEYREVMKKYQKIMLNELKRTDAGFVNKMPKLKLK